jgi:sulfite oxidase
MNGQPLPRDHGFPCRALVPGFAGARNCKWLTDISLEPDPSLKPWHENAYRGFSPELTFQDHLYAWEDSPSVRLHGAEGRLDDHAPIALEQPIQSMICNPPPNATIGGRNLRAIEVRGVAWSGGGRGVHRVDCSIDGGKSFYGAELFKPLDLDHKEIRMRQWGWYHFRCEVPLTEVQISALKRRESIKIDCCSKAVNGDYNVQPETPGPVYNARGIQINHYYHVPISVDGRRDKSVIIRDDEAAEKARFRNYPTGGRFLIPWKNTDGSQDEERINKSEEDYENNIWWNYTQPPEYAERHIDY